MTGDAVAILILLVASKSKNLPEKETKSKLPTVVEAYQNFDSLD
jgi:hypothetical protein